MAKLWAAIMAVFKKLFGGGASLPIEVTDAREAVQEWWDIYRCKAPWVPQYYVTADGRKRKRNRRVLNMAKVSCSDLAGLVFAETPDVDAGDLVKSVLDKERFWANLMKSTELQGALGGQVVKILLATNGEMSFDFVPACNFIPLQWDNAEVYEAAFVDRRVVGNKKYVRLETHQRTEKPGVDGQGNPTGVPSKGYTITNKVFDEDTQQEVPISLFPEEVSPEVFIPVDVPLFAYIANPEANNGNPESPLGVSLYANAIPTLEAIDVAFDQFFSELELGGRRIALPGAVFRKALDEEGVMRSYFDKADRVFLRLEGDDAEKFKPQDMTSDIRSQAFHDSIQTLLDLYAMQIGFDAGYYKFDGATVMTATEVISDNSHTFKTVQLYRNEIDHGLKQLFKAINAIGLYFGFDGATDADPSITWDDSVIEDRNSKATYYTGLYNSHLIDRVTALMKIHGLEEPQAQAMAEKIKAETQIVPAGGLFGNDGGSI